MREKILDAAFEILHESGVKNLTQPKVADKVDIRQSHLTYYYPLKIDLLKALVDRFQTEASEKIQQLSATDDERILGTIAEHMTQPDHMKVFVGLLVEAQTDEELRKMLAEHTHSFRHMLSEKLNRDPEDTEIQQVLDYLRGVGLKHLLFEHEADEIDVQRFLSRL